MAIEIRRASRRQAWLKLAITGVSGAGKTYSSLMLAQGLAANPLLIDTENGSGELYSHLMDYDYIRLSAPFTPAKFVEAIEAAVRHGNDLVIVDSLSHAWRYVLDYKDGLDSGNPRAGFANWRKAKKLFDETMTAILQSPIHVVACMREKSEYTETVDSRGTKTMQKTGTQPIAEPDLEFEFTVCWKLDRSHQAVATKDRTEIWDVSTPFTISRRTGEQLKAWLQAGGGSLERDPAWRATMLVDEETNGLLREADRVLEPARRSEVSYRQLIDRWHMSERDWTEFKSFAASIGAKASAALVEAYQTGARDLHEAYEILKPKAVEPSKPAGEVEAEPAAAAADVPLGEDGKPNPFSDDAGQPGTAEAFGFKPSRMPVDTMYERPRSRAQKELVQANMARRGVEDEPMAATLAKVIAAEFGCSNVNSSAAHSLVIEFLAHATDEQFDLAYAKADRLHHAQ